MAHARVGFGAGVVADETFAVIEDLSHDLMLGMPFHARADVRVDNRNRTLWVQEKEFATLADSHVDIMSSLQFRRHTRRC